MSNLHVYEQHLMLAYQVVDALTSPPPSAESPLCDLARIWLAGSVAAGKDTEQSDVDIVVTKKGARESFPFPFLDAVTALLESAQMPLRPPGLYRRKYPGTVQVLVEPEETIRNPSSLRVEDFANQRLWENTVRFWQSIRSSAIRLY